MSLTRKVVTFALLGAVVSAGWLTAVSAEVAATGPATAPATEPKQARSVTAIQADLMAANSALRESMPSLKSIGDAKFRKEKSAAVLPPLKKMIVLLDEIGTTQNEPAAAKARLQMMGIAAVFGDEESTKTLTDVAGGKDAEAAMTAKNSLAFGLWVQNSEDAKAQDKVLTDYIEVAKAHPTDDEVAGTLMMMTQVGGANEAMTKKASDTIRTTLTGDVAKQVVAQMDADKAQQDMVGKPLVIAGRTTTDGKFSTESLKGKVVLLDFWATWCGPCKAELPRVKALYKKLHEKGLEIVGIDCDKADDEVNTFIKENAMTWVQLREKDQDGWHPLATKYGVDGIPTMFLIDKKGVLRYTDAREDTETKVTKLLEEPDEKAAATAPAETK